jgi:hypothetical protein
MVSMLAIGPKVLGLKTGGGDGYLRAMKIRSTPFFSKGKYGRRTHVVRFCSMLKISKSMKKIFRRQNPSFPSPRSS